MKVRDVMTTQVVNVPPGMRLKELARVLSEARIGGAPVVNEEGEVIGVVSEADLVGKQIGRPPSRRAPLDWIFGNGDDAWELRHRAAITVEDAMTAPAITVAADRPLREVAAIMVDRDVNRLPVMEDGRLVGIVTRADLVRAYLGRDDAILRAIRDDVIKRRMWLDPDQLRIEVVEGIVHLSGSVDRRSTAGLLEKLIGLVDGVDGVESRLSWDFDDTEIQPPAAEEEDEPGAASLAARERPRAIHG